jgi:hypothetical protein
MGKSFQTEINFESSLIANLTLLILISIHIIFTNSVSISQKELAHIN